jgi:uncharacterized membrane protein
MSRPISTALISGSGDGGWCCTSPPASLLQLWLGFTRRVARLHPALGKVYLGAIAAGSTAGFYLALTIPGNPAYASGLFMLCVAWVVTTSMAVLAIRRRNRVQHREWMTRSYVVTFAFVTFRFGVDLLTARGMQPADAQAVMAWACWAAPLLLVEPLLQLRSITSYADSATRSRQSSP